LNWSIFATVIVILGVAGLAVFAVLPEDQASVVLYCTVDQDQSRQQVDLFEQESGLSVRFQGDTENDKSVGLARRLSAEHTQKNAKADVFWANEIMNTVWLAEGGAFDPLPKDVLDQFEPRWRDPEGRWVAFGLRARVLMVNTKLVPDKADWPTKVADLLDPKWAQRGLLTAMAAPLTGTTYTHGVALLTRDEAGTKAFFEQVMAAAADNRMKVTPSNGSAMNMTRDPANKIAFCLTDTDDAWIAKSAGFPVETIYPDQHEGGLGTFVIPNTLSKVAGRPANPGTERLLRWLASPEHEARLAAGPGAQIPVRPGVAVPADGHVKRPGTDFRVADTDWVEVGRNRDRWFDWLTRVFRPAR
jgi:iron(III) transport system substrate-binding protein